MSAPIHTREDLDRVAEQDPSQPLLDLIEAYRALSERRAIECYHDAIQAHGGAGVSEDFGLARAYASLRTLRLADGPDEVHCRAISRLEFKRHSNQA